MQSCPRVLAIHDLSGFGHTSLLEVIPVLYRMGLEAAVLPSALLSANTDHEGYRLLDTRDFISQTLTHWGQMGLHFDAVFSGFLGSAEQVAILKQAIPGLQKAHAPVLVDPVLGDDGKLYSCYHQDMVIAMRELIGISSIITPNFTEAALLLDKSFPQPGEAIDLKAWGKDLSQMGPETVVITSAPGAAEGETKVYCYHRPSDEGREFSCRYVPVVYPGTGDCFAALLLGGIMNGFSIWQSVHGAVSYLSAAIAASIPLVADRRTGIALARVLVSDPLDYMRTSLEN